MPAVPVIGDVPSRCLDQELAAPVFPCGSVRRTPRLGMLGDVDAPLIVVATPPGYGKTTLIAEWAERDPRPFLYVRVGDGVDVGAIHRLVDRGSKPLVVAIDDAHLLPGEHAEGLVDAVVERAPRGSHVVVATRGCAHLRLGRRRAAHEVLELGVAALAFEPDEAAALVAQTGLALADASVTTLVERTAGWPAGLSLALSAVQAGADADAAALAFSGDDHFVAEYVREEVLEPLPADAQSFLRRTAVLERLSEPLCDAVLIDGSAAAMREVLADVNAMIQPVDRAGDWYRLHPLLREALSHELRVHDRALFATLHRRASDWWESAGDDDNAIRHAIHAGDCARARELIWRALPAAVAENAELDVAGWIELLGRPALVADPALALAVAAFELADGNPGEVEWWISVAEDGSVADDDTREGTRELLHALVANDGPADMRERAARAGDLIAPPNPLHFLARAFELFAIHMEGEHGAARSGWDDLVRRSVVRLPHAEAVGEAFFALAAVEEGGWTEAAHRIERSRSVVNRHAWLSDKPGQALTFAVSAACHARVGSASDATRDVQRARTLLGRLPGFEPWVAVLTCSALARASILLHEFGPADSLIRDARGLIRAAPPWAALLPGVAAVGEMAALARLADLTSGERSLTKAENRVLKLLPTHLSLGEIAAELLVSRNTVKSQTVAVYRKLDVSSRREAVDRARALHLLESPQG